MKITGPDIVGTSAVNSGGSVGSPGNCVDQIEVSSYSFSGIRPFELGALQEASTFEFRGLECVMALDGRAYSSMLTGLAARTTYTEIVLEGVSFTLPDAARVFFKLELKNTAIEPMSQQGTNGDQPIVNAVFRPTSIRITTPFIRPNGSASDPVVFQRNLLAGAATY